MTISIDTTNKPATNPTTNSGSWGTARTSGSFTPQAGTLLLVAVAAGGTASAGPTVTVTDNHSNTFTQLTQVSAARTNLIGIYMHYYATSPGSTTITAQAAGAGLANGGMLDVIPVLGANSTQTATPVTVTHAPAAGTLQGSVTVASGNIAVGGASNFSDNAAFTALAGTTIHGEFDDATNGDAWVSWSSTSTGTNTLGFSTNKTGAFVGIEIQAASASDTDLPTTPAGQAWAGAAASTVIGINEATTPAGIGWAGTVASTAVGVLAATTAAALVWAGTQATLVTDTVERVAPAAQVWAGTPTSLAAPVTLATDPASIVWAGTTSTLLIGSGLHTPFDDTQGATLVQSNDTTGPITLMVGGYETTLTNAYLVGVRVYVPAGSGAGGAGFVAHALNSSTAGNAPDQIIATAPFPTVATDAYTVTMFDSPIALSTAKFWVDVWFPNARYGFKNSVFGSAVVFHDLAGIFLGATTDFTHGNQTFSYGPVGTIAVTASSGSGRWYGVEPIVAIGPLDVTLKTAPAAVALAGAPTSIPGPVTEATAPAALVWAGTPTSITGANTQATSPGALAWAGTKATTVVDVLVQSKPAAYAVSSAAPTLDIASVLQGSGPPAVVWAGTPVTVGSTASVGLPTDPAAVAWGGTAGRLTVGVVDLAKPAAVLWAGTTATLVVQGNITMTVRPAVVVWAGAPATLVGGVEGDIVVGPGPNLTVGTATVTPDPLDIVASYSLDYSIIVS